MLSVLALPLAYLPDAGVLAAFSLAVVVLTLTPGPDMAFFLGKAIGQSTAAGFAAYAGVAAGLLVHTTLVALGLSALLAASATAFTILKIVGALYLVFLAVEAIRHGSVLARPLEGMRPDPLLRVFGKGLAINLLNPKIIVFFATFLPQFVSAGDPAAAGKMIVLGLVLLAVSTPITVVLILGAGRVSSTLRGSRRIARALDWLFAGVMAAFAVRLIVARGS